jgi:hypothetical protein
LVVRGQRRQERPRQAATLSRAGHPALRTRTSPSTTAAGRKGEGKEKKEKKETRKRKETYFSTHVSWNSKGEGKEKKEKKEKKKKDALVNARVVELVFAPAVRAKCRTQSIN